MPIQAPELIRPDWPAPASVFAAVTTRGRAGFNLATHVGDDPERVRGNRRRLAKRLGFHADFQWLRQVHGARPVVVQRVGKALEADALVSRTPGIACCVLSADCLPVFVCSRAGDEVAVIHAGWRGLCAGIVENTLAAMKTPGEELLAWLGPGILACHYEVGEELREAFLAGAGDEEQRQALATAFHPAATRGKYLADLARIAIDKLRAAGLASVSGGSVCTYCQPGRFFSHRRGGVAGRMANVICIRP